MRKSLFLTVLAVLVLGTPAFAAVGTFSVGADMPAATTVAFITSKVPVSTGIFERVGTSTTGAPLQWAETDLTFLPGTTQNPINIWTGDHYYAIDLAATLANGSPAPGNFSSITFAFSNQVVPTGQVTGGLGTRAVVTPVAVTPDGSDANTLPDEIPIGTTKRLNDVASIGTLNNASLLGGFLRVYVGLYTGLPVVAGAVPFTNGDRPGDYSATLTITATVI